MKILYTLFLCFLTFNLVAQNPVQNIRGEVKDLVVKSPIIGASLLLLDDQSETLQSTQSDMDGNFAFEQVSVGRYSIFVNAQGYTPQIISEVIIVAGKETVYSIELQENSYDLEAVTVKSPRSNIDHPVSIQTLTIEETRRFPATYYDPARLAISLAGVVNTNDQSNGLSVRGHSPNALNWRIEGAEIVNPNHTPNAGTASDRITLSGGGVNMLSAQMLGNTSFLSGAFPVGYGNAIGAIMDMNLKDGNRKETELTAQIGLIGIDLAAEGPLGKNEKSSFSTNYRYSTVGLLSQLGVDLGDEEIAFQDLAVKADFLTKKGKFSIFGIGGQSKNIFAAQRDSSLWEFQKDRFDINFNSKTGIGGMSYGQTIGEKSYWKTSLVYSATDNSRTGERLDDDFSKELLENDQITYQKVSLHSVFSHKFSTRNYLKAGLNATLHQFSVLAEDFTTRQFSRGEGQGVMWQPYFNFNSKISEKWTANIGLQASYLDYNNTSALEPRASLSFQMDAKSRLSLAYGLHSQMQSPVLYTAQTVTGGTNKNLELTKAHHFILSYNFQPKSGDNLLIEAYYQRLFDVPQPFLGGTTFSALNLVENYTIEPLESTGTGRNLGAEFTWQKYFSGSFYYLMNATLYDATYTDVNGRRHDTRYNGNYAFNLTGGKEWTKNIANKVKTFGVNLRINRAGGFRYTPINELASFNAGTTIFDLTQPFSEQYPDFFKIDTRIYWKKSKAGRSTTWALDIQNLSNQENVAFQYFDVEVGEIVTKNQLGLLPILTWRIEL